jgi:hypothetical protein
VSGPNGEGLPTHVLVTDELVERALGAAIDAGADRWMTEEEMRAALSEVAPELWQAGVDAGRKTRIVEDES